MQDDTPVDLFNHPRLRRHDAIDKLADALPEAMRRGYRFGELRGSILVLHFTHPAYLNEFKIKKQEILERMRKIYGENKMQQVIKFTDVKAEQRYQPPPKPEQQRESLDFDDRAKGDFENPVTHPGLHASLERIRKIIKERRNGKEDE